MWTSRLPLDSGKSWAYPTYGSRFVGSALKYFSVKHCPSSTLKSKNGISWELGGLKIGIYARIDIIPIFNLTLSGQKWSSKRGPLIHPALPFHHTVVNKSIDLPLPISIFFWTVHYIPILFVIESSWFSWAYTRQNNIGNNFCREICPWNFEENQIIVLNASKYGHH